MKSKEELKSFFENGDIPKQDDFWEWQDSYWHKNEKLPLENVDYDFSNKADLVDGKVPATQLPSYVDDILEFDSLEDLPFPGEGGKIYVITSTNTQLRWSGSEYIQIISGENVMITDSPQSIFPDGTKTFWTDNNNNSLYIKNTNSEGAGITFDSNGVGQIIYNDDQFHFTNNDGTNSIPVISEGFKKEGSNNDFYLTGGGDHVHNLVKEDAWYHSSRDFPNGTLIETDVDYSQDYGDQFLLEIKGNMYDNSMPLDAKVQGYIYLNGANPLLNVAGYTTCYYWKSITALNHNGKLCFWFPRLSYWQGFDVKLTVGYGGIGQGKNRVISVIDSPDPIGTKRVDIYLNTLATQEFVNTNFATNDSVVKLTSKSSLYLGDMGITDLNNLQQTGFFRGSDLANSPNNSPEWFFITVEYHATGWVSQTATTYGTGAAGAVPNRIFKRTFIGGVYWTGWEEVWTERNFNPASKANALENTTGLGFSSGQIPTNSGSEYPYMIHNTGGFIPLATQDFVNKNFHKTDTGSINNGSNSRFNTTWFDYNWAGVGLAGSVINFSGLVGGGYSTELFSDYSSGQAIGIRTHNGDTGTWNPVRYLWHSSNFDPANYALISDLTGYITTDTPQGIFADKSFAPNTLFTIYGNESNNNNTQSFNSTGGNGSLVSGWVNTFYNSRWKYGIVRGGDGTSANVKFGFDFSIDGGVTYYRTISIDGNTGALELGAGGKLDSNGDLTLKQITNAPNATGMWWNNKDGSGDRIAGIGILTNSGDYQYNYMGWGTSPWLASNNLSVSQDTFTYKGDDIWHGGNLDPDSKVNKSGDTMTGNLIVPNLVLSSSLISSQVLSGSQVIAAAGDSMYIGNSTGGLNNLALESVNDLKHFKNSVPGVIWTAHNLDVDNLQTLNTDQNISASKSYYGSIPFKFKNSSFKSWAFHKPATNDLIFAPSLTANAEDWDWTNQVRFTDFGEVVAKNFIANQAFWGDNFKSNTLAGNQFITTNSTELYFGNPSIPAVFYQSQGSQNFFVNDSQIATINSTGLYVTGNIQLNGQNVATQDYVHSNYYTATQVNDFFIEESQKGAANGVATLDSSGLVPTTQLPSYVDDVLEFANLTSFPTTGESSKIYVAIDTNKTYRWSGSAYIFITSGAVDSVNGHTGVINLTTSNISEGSNLYYTNARVKVYADTLYSLLGHTHTIANITGLQTALDLKANGAQNATGVGFSSGQFPTNDGVQYPYMVFDNGATVAYIALATQGYVSTNYATISALNGKANALENATAIGFSGGNVPTNDGSQYPYIYHSIAGGNIALATQGWVNNTFATLNSLSDFVTKSTAQTISASKTFDSASTVSFTGNDQNNVLIHKTSTGSAGLVSGHDYTHYNTRWRVGNIRGNSTDSTGFGFNFSSDNGATFSNLASISSNGQINSAIHGNSSEWNDIFQNGVRVGNTGFTVLEDYREIDDHPFDIDDVTVEKFNIVFDASANGQVIIHSLPDGQTYHLHNFSASNILRVDVEGYGNVDNIEPGETKVYMAHHSGHLRRISASNTDTII